MPNQTREFVDERFGNLIITNDGSPYFVVHELASDGRYAPIDEFKAVESNGRDSVSEVFARQRAARYFDTLAKSNGYVQDQEGMDEVPKADYPADETSPGARRTSPEDVDALILRAQSERDPEKARALRQQALAMMAQESKRRGESRAQCWTRHLVLL